MLFRPTLKSFALQRILRMFRSFFSFVFLFPVHFFFVQLHDSCKYEIVVLAMELWIIYTIY
jgi:hypothetical protein